MKRNAVTWFVLGAATYAFCACLTNDSGSAKADVPKQTLAKPYTPSFREWADVWLRSILASDVPGRGTVVGWKPTARGVKYSVQYFYPRGTKEGEQQKRLIAVKKMSVDAQVAHWAAAGYDIKPTDIQWIDRGS